MLCILFLTGLLGNRQVLDCPNDLLLGTDYGGTCSSHLDSPRSHTRTLSLRQFCPSLEKLACALDDNTPCVSQCHSLFLLGDLLLYHIEPEACLGEPCGVVVADPLLKLGLGGGHIVEVLLL